MSVGADSRSRASTCSGLVQPGSCPPEPLHDESRFTRGRGELSVALMRHRRSALDLVAGFEMGHIQPETDGRTSGAHVTADKMIWGTDIGGELRWIPSSTVPLGFEASLAVGGYQPAGSTVIVDGDTPFEQSFDVKRLRVGAVLELP